MKYLAVGLIYLGLFLVPAVLLWCMPILAIFLPLLIYACFVCPELLLIALLFPLYAVSVLEEGKSK